MKGLKWGAIPLGLCLGMLAASAGATGVEPGLWKIDSTSRVTGLPFAMAPRAATYQRCVTPRQAQNIWKSTNAKQEGHCNYSKLEKTGNHVSWQVTCTGQGKMEGRGELTLVSPAAYHGKVDIRMESQGMSMATHMTFNAHRIGACSPKP